MSVYGKTGHRVDRGRPPSHDPGGEHERPKLRECVVLSGGISGEPTHAVAGSLKWHKDRREKVGAFIERAKTEAVNAGHDMLIVKGLKW